MKTVRCVIKVDIDEEKLERLGYENVDDYLNECKFCVFDDEHDDICFTVEEYQTK